jgi:putative PIN family toxin of toxin-antitoxin system
VRVVLDSNLLFSALISPSGKPAEICRAWQSGRFVVVTCVEQLDEVRRASRYPKLKKILQPHLVGRMVNHLRRAHIVVVNERTHHADDPHDAYLLDLAEVGAADYLVTGDKRSGLLARRRIGRAAILTATQFQADVLEGKQAGSR